MAAAFAPESEDPGRLFGLAVMRHPQQGTRHPYLAHPEELVEQIFLHPDVACQHVGDEQLGEALLVPGHQDHGASFDKDQGARPDGDGTPDPKGLARRAASPRKSPGPRTATTASLPTFDCADTDTTRPDVEHMLADVAFGEIASPCR